MRLDLYLFKNGLSESRQKAKGLIDDELVTVNGKTVTKSSYEVSDVDCVKLLGKGLAYIIDILNPEIIVIGSIFTRAEDLLREGMMEVLEREALPLSLQAVRILPAALGEAIGDMAALGVAASGG